MTSKCSDFLYYSQTSHLSFADSLLAPFDCIWQKEFPLSRFFSFVKNAKHSNYQIDIANISSTFDSFWHYLGPLQCYFHAKWSILFVSKTARASLIFSDKKKSFDKTCLHSNIFYLIFIFMKIHKRAANHHWCGNFYQSHLCVCVLSLCQSRFNK